MKLSIQSEHALLSIIHLARQNQPVSLAQLAFHQPISTDGAAEIFAALQDAGYLQQQTDGFVLIKDAATISVLEIIQLFDGALAPVEPVSSKGYLPAPMDQEEKLCSLFDSIQADMLKRLEKTSLAELV